MNNECDICGNGAEAHISGGISAVAQIKQGLYRHYKGNEYEAIWIAKHSETLEEMVVYKALYGEGGIWVRPISMWDELVEVDGRAVKRFEYIGD